MAIQVEEFVSDLQEKLHSDSSFLKTFSDYSTYVKGLFIHIPQAGASPSIGVDTVTFPLTATSRLDTDRVIRTHYYDTGAVKLPRIETGQLSYDKQKSVMEDYYATLAEKMGDIALQSIVPTKAAKQLTTLGATMTFDDVIALAAALDMDKVPQADRYLALPTKMYYELMADERVAKASYNGFGSSVIGTLKVQEVGGFKVWQRPNVAVNGAGKLTGIAYVSRAVVRSESSIDMFVNEGANGNGDALYLGPVVSAGLFAGFGLKREDEAGVVSISHA